MAVTIVAPSRAFMIHLDPSMNIIFHSHKVSIYSTWPRRGPIKNRSSTNGLFCVMIHVLFLHSFSVFLH